MREQIKGSYVLARMPRSGLRHKGRDKYAKEGSNPDQTTGVLTENPHISPLRFKNAQCRPYSNAFGITLPPMAVPLRSCAKLGGTNAYGGSRLPLFRGRSVASSCSLMPLSNNN